MLKDENFGNDDILRSKQMASFLRKLKSAILVWDNRFSTSAIPVLSDPTILENSARYKAVAITIPNPMSGTERKTQISFTGILKRTY